MDDRIEGAFLNRRQKLCSTKDSVPNTFGPCFPFVQVRITSGKFVELLSGSLLALKISLAELRFALGLFFRSTLSGKTAGRADCEYEYGDNEQFVNIKRAISIANSSVF